MYGRDGGRGINIGGRGRGSRSPIRGNVRVRGCVSRFIPPPSPTPSLTPPQKDRVTKHSTATLCPKSRERGNKFSYGWRRDPNPRRVCGVLGGNRATDRAGMSERGCRNGMEEAMGAGVHVRLGRISAGRKKLLKPRKHGDFGQPPSSRLSTVGGRQRTKREKETDEKRGEKTRFRRVKKIIADNVFFNSKNLVF